MTICIAALAENGKKIVLAADQMITANIPISYQFDTNDVKKIYDIAENIVVMTAGNALFAQEIIDSASKEIQAKGHKDVSVIAEVLRQTYQNFRRTKVIRHYLEPRGLDLNSYIGNQQRLHSGVVQEIEKAFTSLNINVDLIVTGYTNDICHIYSITHPGDLVTHDSIGYACVGSGAPHALYYLIGENYKKSKSVEEVEKLVKEAKKKSEVAPGVGKETTIKILPTEREKNV